MQILGEDLEVFSEHRGTYRYQHHPIQLLSTAKLNKKATNAEFIAEGLFSPRPGTGHKKQSRRKTQEFSIFLSSK